MVSGFLISPYDHDRIFSGDAIEIRIWSKTWAGVVGLKRFIISWFIVFSSRAGRCRQQIRKSPPQGALPGGKGADDRTIGAKSRFALWTGHGTLELLGRLGRRRRTHLG